MENQRSFLPEASTTDVRFGVIVGQMERGLDGFGFEGYPTHF